MASGPTDNATLRVVIVDNHPIMRGGLVAVIAAEPDMEVVAEAEDGLTALEVAARLAPDVIVMDLSMPTLDGAEATRRIKALQPDVKVLMLSAHREPANIQSAMDAGAAGYVLKRTAARDLVVALRAVATGGTYLDPSVAAHALSARRSSVPPTTPLSQRETEVVKLIARGYAIKEIAAALDVSARTLETYKARAMEKLGFRSRPDLVRYAAQRGWLESL